MISVIFSSHNGDKDLRRMLDSMTRLTAPNGGWRLIAVDNASADDTGLILKSYADRLPLTVLYEPQLGKNVALNRAIEVAEGDAFVFTDDDVIVSEDWLVQWRSVIDAQPDFDFFAGRTEALFAREPPAWLLDGVEVGVVYAAHREMTEGPSSPLNVYGPNMAVRAALFADGVRYDATIGPDGTRDYAMGSETELALRLERQGHKCWFARGPSVQHIVPSEYLEPAWVLRRGYRWGRGLARMRFDHPCTPSTLASKNLVKGVVYPVLLPLLGREASWRRRWEQMVDRGYEDGTRDGLGLAPRWASER